MVHKFTQRRDTTACNGYCNIFFRYMWALLPHEGLTFCNRHDCPLVTTGRYTQVLLVSVSCFVSLERMVIIQYDWSEIQHMFIGR
jgi:hypothetical protein